ncbi:hypothetical protein N8390_09975 [Amylibacter sp.]|nr:hypothetical protein [Amylibacter sp.]
MHSSFARSIVQAYGPGGEFKLPFTSSLYNIKANLRSNAYLLIYLSEMKRSSEGIVRQT